MTFAVGALLQLGLSMDYSIMLINRYNQEKLENPTPAVAMKKSAVPCVWSNYKQFSNNNCRASCSCIYEF